MTEHVTIPAITQQAMQTAIGSIKRAASATGRAATPAALNVARVELQRAIDRLNEAYSDIAALGERIDR